MELEARQFSSHGLRVCSSERRERPALNMGPTMILLRYAQREMTSFAKAGLTRPRLAIWSGSRPSWRLSTS